MYSPELKTAEHWIDLIANSELPAITSTARLLDRFSNDDKSSLPKLSRAILHDQALSSCLLKVANNTQHFSVNKVTTVSRATVVLGIKTVKNICLTAKLVSSLLASKDLAPDVYDALTQQMANSFYAGQLAKMMVPGYSEEMKEEMYLAAMLYRIGETAFWSVGGEVAQQLSNFLDESDVDFDHNCRELIGGSFNELSTGLANAWGLSDLLIKALDHPTTRTDEIKIIYFADRLSSIIANPEGKREEYQHTLHEVANIMHITPRQLVARITHIHEQAEKLLSAFGAEILIDKIKPLPKLKDFIEREVKKPKADYARDKALLDSFMSLTALMKKSKDFNEYLQLALTNIANTFNFDLSSFLMLVDEHKKVKSRFVIDNEAQFDDKQITVTINQCDNLISRVLDGDEAALVNDFRDNQWRDLISLDIETLINNGTAAFIPVKIADKAIGVMCLQQFDSTQHISTRDFRQVCSYVEHLNMCLTMIKYT